MNEKFLLDTEIYGHKEDLNILNDYFKEISEYRIEKDLLKFKFESELPTYDLPCYSYLLKDPILFIKGLSCLITGRIPNIDTPIINIKDLTSGEELLSIPNRKFSKDSIMLSSPRLIYFDHNEIINKINIIKVFYKAYEEKDLANILRCMGSELGWGYLYSILEIIRSSLSVECKEKGIDKFISKKFEVPIDKIQDFTTMANNCRDFHQKPRHMGRRKEKQIPGFLRFGQEFMQELVIKWINYKFNIQLICLYEEIECKEPSKLTVITGTDERNYWKKNQTFLIPYYG